MIGIIKKTVITLLSCLTISSLLCAQVDQVTEEEAEQIGIEAYIFGYPLVRMEALRRFQTNVLTPSAGRAPMGSFSSVVHTTSTSSPISSVPEPQMVVTTAWLDVSQQPVAIEFPDHDDRLFYCEFTSAWAEVFASVGKRTTGARPQKYVVTGPGWSGELPSGYTELRSPTGTVLVTSRIFCLGTDKDLSEVIALRNNYRIHSLGTKNLEPSQILGEIAPVNTTGSDVLRFVNDLDIGEYLNIVSKQLEHNPPQARDAPVVNRLKKIGLIPGAPFDINVADHVVAKGLRKVAKPAQIEIYSYFKEEERLPTGWYLMAGSRSYATKYRCRAYYSYIGYGLELPQECVTAITAIDSEGRGCVGSNKYRWHFSKDQLPPTKQFWSLACLAQEDIGNPQRRRTSMITSHHGLRFNPDGSLDIYIQSISPGKKRESNWIQAPEKKFSLRMMIYEPAISQPSVLDGTWFPPAVVRAK